jgi:feruloyl esterase
VTLTFGTLQPANPMPPVGAAAQPAVRQHVLGPVGEVLRHARPARRPARARPGQSRPWTQRIVELNGIQDANRTDFSAFRARGGKILIAHGVHDGLVSNKATRQFVSRVNSTMGSDVVPQFLRYYEIPGYNHAVSSEFNAAWDSLTALEAWVEQGTAPASQVVADTAAVPGRTRPLCEYPSWPRYDGSGDVDAASSFACVAQ